MAEWLKAHAWKACKREIVSGVRIPSSLQLLNPCNLVIVGGFYLVGQSVGQFYVISTPSFLISISIDSIFWTSSMVVSCL